jgi:hypothetical protein
VIAVTVCLCGTQTVEARRSYVGKTSLVTEYVHRHRIITLAGVFQLGWHCVTWAF